MYKFIKEIREQYLVNDKDIREIEEKWNIQFPAVLKDYYRNYNGAHIDLCKFYVGEYLHEIVHIVPLKYGDLCLEKFIEDNRQDAIIPDNMMPIGRNRGGDYYYWDTSSEKVFVFFCDDIEDPIHVCNSIEELFDYMDKGCN